MRYLDLGVRRLLEVCGLLLGGVLVLASVWLGGFTVVTPECSVDIDHGDAVLATRVMTGGWVVLELVVAALAWSSFRRASPEQWKRVLPALSLPVGAVVLWAAYAASLGAVHRGLDAGAGSSACW